MKKNSFILLMVAAMVLLPACHNKGKPELISTTSISSANPTEISLPVYIPGSIEINHVNDYGEEDGLNYKLSFRRIYYILPGWLSELAEAEAYDNFFEEQVTYNPDLEITEMFMVTFIKHCDIPKHEFVAANEKHKALSISMGKDIYNEYDEIPNADIIYTFDNEIINEYYRRE